MPESKILKKILHGPKLEKDKGFAWVVLVMSGLSQMMSHGFNYAVVGNLTIAHQDLFGVSLQKGSLIGSVNIALFGMFGPMSSVLIHCFGQRRTQIAGGIIMVLSLGLSTLTTNYWHAILLFGILGGFGASTTYTASASILALHFDRRKYFAFSAATVGFYIGLTVWPIASQKLLDSFTYSKAMGIMAAAQAIHVLAGVFYLEPVPQCTGSLKLHELSSGDKHTNQAAVSDDASFDSQKNNNPNERPVEKEEIKTTPTVAEEVKDKSSYIRLLKREFITILKSINVWLFLVHSLLHGANSSSFFILINDYIFHHTSLTKDEVAIGITILGFSNVAGCLVVVASSALKYNRLVSQGTFILIYAVATIIMAFTSNKTMFYFLCGCWGIGKGCSIANLLASVSQICQTEQLGLTLGLALLCEGIGSLTGTSLISFVAQDLQQQAAVILSGCLGVAGSSCLIPIVVRKYRERQKTRANNNIEWDNAAYIN